MEPTQKHRYKTVFKLCWIEPPEFGLFTELGTATVSIDWEVHSYTKRRQRHTFNHLIKSGNVQNLAKMMKLQTKELMSKNDETAD